MTHVVIIAGEASGDRIGAGLIRALRALDPEIRISGVAGPEMRAAGCEAWFDSESLAVMGLVEVLRHLPRLRRLFHQLEQRLREDRPDVLVGIDAPDFNLRLLPRARGRNPYGAVRRTHGLGLAARARQGAAQGL